MQQIDKRAMAFMRWVIVLTLFGAVIYQSNRIDELKSQLASEAAQCVALAKSCQK